MTNAERAELGQQALDLMDDVDQETQACDLLADLMHNAKRDGWSFETALDRAKHHFEYEIAGYPDSEIED